MFVPPFFSSYFIYCVQKIALYFSLSVTFVFIFICSIINIKYFIFVIPYGSLLLFSNLYVVASYQRSIEFHVCMLHGYESVRKRIPIRASEINGILLKLFFCDKTKEFSQIDDGVASINNFLTPKCVCTNVE